jgi:hypothetical protein
MEKRMKKKILIGVGVVVVLLIILVVAALKTDSPECVELKAAVCELCGESSTACEKVQASIATTEDCVSAMGTVTAAKGMIEAGGDAAKKLFCDQLAK